MKKILSLAFVVIFLSIAAFGCRDDGSGNDGNRVSDITLTVWGIFDSESDLYPIFSSYKKLSPEVKINYRAVPLSEYEKLLLNGLAEGEGPDIFLIHNTWLPKFQRKLAAAPADKIPFETFQETFVSVVEEDFTNKQEIFALPQYVDTLGIYYNYNYYKKSKLGKPRASWEEFLEDIDSVTDKVGNSVSLPGIALGTSNNVHQSADILMQLFLQNNLEFYSPQGNTTQISNSEGLKSIEFYTSFADPKSDRFTWKINMNDDSYEFIHGNVATLVGYSYLIEQISAQARTTGLDFRTAKFPQFDTKNPVNFADYWGYAAKKNPGKELRVRYAWDLIEYMSNEESARKYFEKRHRPPARRALVREFAESNPLYKPFIEQVPYAKSITMYDRETYNKALEDAITSVLNGISPTKALKDAAKIINEKIALYIS